MIRRPRRFTLFPYTTLFRSRVRDRGPDAGRRDHVPARRGVVHDQDRKSTRLNSSHSQSSYAVFCLEKKNPITRPASSRFRKTPPPTSTTRPSPRPEAERQTELHRLDLHRRRHADRRFFF